MRPVTVAVLGKFPDIFNGFRESADLYMPSVPKVFVRDGNEIKMPTDSKWTCIQGEGPFSNPGFANIAWQAAASDSDILYCGDDVRFMQQDTVELLREIAYSDPCIGILSPRIIGAAGNNLQVYPKAEGITYSTQRLAFICVYIKREVIDKVGYMDPIFGGSYGYDDSDYNYRTQLAGYKLAVTPRVSVEHKHAASTFTRTGPGSDCRLGEEKFRTKWGAKALSDTEQGLPADAVVLEQTRPQAPLRTGRAPQRLKRQM